jgi:hypothetical protein
LTEAALCRIEIIEAILTLKVSSIYILSIEFPLSIRIHALSIDLPVKIEKSSFLIAREKTYALGKRGQLPRTQI